MSVRPDEASYHELCAYTLQHPDQDSFIHQYVVDAYAAQTANEQAKPITLLFALAGLYLHVERRYTGKQVQRAHMEMAKAARKDWPTLPLPNQRGAMTAVDVMRFPEGTERDAAIKRWSRAVWESWRDQHQTVATLVNGLIHV
jgi:hypothetical protein